MVESHGCFLCGILEKDRPEVGQDGVPRRFLRGMFGAGDGSHAGIAESHGVFLCGMFGNVESV